MIFHLKPAQPERDAIGFVHKHQITLLKDSLAQHRTGQRVLDPSPDFRFERDVLYFNKVAREFPSSSGDWDESAGGWTQHGAAHLPWYSVM
jgi:hypothetical protein